MAVVYNSNQVKWGDRGYLDAKMQPVANVAALPSDPTEVFEGMTVVVLNDGSGKPCDYWRVNGAWVKKESGAEGIAEVQEELAAVESKLGDSFTSAYTVADAIESVNSALAGKVDAEAGKGLSSNDFSDAEKDKLEGIEAGAQANVQIDWNAESGLSSIANKPDLSQYAKASDLDDYAKSSDLDAVVQEAKDEAIIAAAEYVDDQDFLKASALTETLQDYAKTDDVEAALQDYAKSEEVEAALSAYTKTEDLESELADYAKSADVEAELAGYAKSDDVASALTEYAKAADVQEAFDNVATSMTATYQAAVSAATEAAQQAVEDEGYAKADDVATAITEAVSTKQDALTAGAAISLENNEVSVLFDNTTIKVNDAGKLYAIGGGGEGGTTYSPGQYIKIEDSVISVTGITPDDYATKAALSAETEARAAADESLSDDILAAKAALSAETSARWSADESLEAEIQVVNAAVSAETAAREAAIEEAKAEVLSAATEAAVAEIDNEGYVKEEDVASAITAAVAEKQDVLTAGKNITIENNVISAEFEVDLDDYATKDEVASAATEAAQSAIDYVDGQQFVKSDDLKDYATKDELSSAATEAAQAAMDYVDGQQFVTSDELDGAVAEAVSAVTEDFIDGNDLEEAKAAAVADAINEIDDRGYVNENFVNSAITNSEESVKDWVDEQGFLKEHQDISGKMDVFEAGDGLAFNEGKLDVLVDDATIKVNPTTGKLYAIGGGEGGATYSPGQYIEIENNVISVTGITPDEYATKAELSSASSATLQAAKDFVAGEDFAKADDVQDALDELVEYTTTAITAAQDATLAEAKEYVDGQEFVKPEDIVSAVTAAVEAGHYMDEDAVDAAIAEAVSTKQDTLTAGKNITIENNVISADVQDIDLDDYAKKEDLENVVADVATAITASHEAAVEEAKAWVDEQKFATSEEVASAVTEAIEEGNYMDEAAVLSAITEANEFKQDKLTAGKNIMIEDNVISASFDIDLDGYATKEDLENVVEDVATAITASYEAAVAEAQTYVDKQNFATSEEVASAATAVQAWVDEQKFATLEEVSSAVTEAMEESDYMDEEAVLAAISSATESKQDVLTAGENITIENNVISANIDVDLDDYATKDELTSAATEAAQAAMDYVDGQGFLKEEDIADAITAATQDFVTQADLEDAKAEAVSAATEAAAEAMEDEGYAKADDVATAITESLNTATAYTKNALSGITHPEYSLVSASSQQYAAVYDLKKDGNAIANSAQIRIPKGAQLESELVADVAVGNVSAGTVFAAGTSIESILRQIFTNASGPVGQTLYGYYGSIGWDDAMYDEDEAPITEAGIKSLCTRSAGDVGVDEPIVFTVQADDYEIIIAVPAIFTVASILDIDHAMTPWTQEFELKKQMMMDGINYNIYSYDQDSPLTQFRMQITLQNA